MEISEYIGALRREGQLLASAAAAAGPDTSVPTCPDWTVRDLVRHQGGVHRWAAEIVARPRTAPWRVDLDDVVGSWPTDADLVDWFRQGHASLVTALTQADPKLECWTFLAAPSPLAMWARRQAHETAVHRADAELAAGARLSPLAAPFAADGIDELLTCFITRPGSKLRADPPRVLSVRCTDASDGWRVRIGPDRVETTHRAGRAEPAGTMPSGGDCQVSGRAAEVYLALWNRQATESLPVEGDRQVLGLFRDAVRIRWS